MVLLTPVTETEWVFCIEKVSRNGNEYDSGDGRSGRRETSDRLRMNRTFWDELPIVEIFRQKLDRSVSTDRVSYAVTRTE